MNRLQDNTFANSLFKAIPIVVLFISVFNEFDIELEEEVIVM